MPSFKNAFSLLQKIGKCMMLPVSVLPVAGILLGVGSANFSWLPESVSLVMAKSGDAIFGNLPLLFAIGVAIGLTENDGVAALAGTTGYVVFLAAMGVCAKLRGIEVTPIMGIPSIQAGAYTDATGTTVNGEIARFIAGDPTAGHMTGGYLFKMWGLPAAALAMWRAARPENRAKVGGIMISAALTAFLTGITEPIEFAFIFVAPALYVIHAVLAGLSYFVCVALGIRHGFTFSHVLIDFVVLFPKSHH